jgi:hypothetical protein
MPDPEHYTEAERLLALADRHARRVTYGREWAPTARVPSSPASAEVQLPETLCNHNR